MASNHRVTFTPRIKHARRGGAGIAVAGALAIGALGYLSVSMMSGPGDAPTDPDSSGVSASAQTPHVYNRWALCMLAMKLQHEADHDVVRALSLAGVTPDTLAAAGVTAGSVSGVVTNARSYLSEHGETLWAAMDAHREAVASQQSSQRRVVSGLASENEKSAAASACSTLSSACSSRDSALDALFAAATDGLGNDQKTAMATLRANKGKSFPVKYLAASRTEAQWVALRDALANVRIAAKTGEEAGETESTLVSTTDAEESVTSAASGLSNNLAGVTSAWNSAVAG